MLPGLNGETRLYGVLGHPVRATLSPAMHNAAFQALGINAVYVAFPVPPAQLVAAVRGLVAAGLCGFNLTVPHKTAILPLLDGIEGDAQVMGAVNTVRCAEGRLTGTNTDGDGFLLSLRHDLDFDPAGRDILLLGAGGAARGIAHSLLAAGAARLRIANRGLERARALVEECRARFPAARVEALTLEQAPGTRPDLLVNATTVGMGDGRAPLDLARVGVRQAVLDIVYHPAETPLLAQAGALGLRRANGVGMLLQQGWLAFRFWTGREPPLDVMREALQRGLSAREH
jgi:shikimate dehydrogenase